MCLSKFLWCKVLKSKYNPCLYDRTCLISDKSWHKMEEKKEVEQSLRRWRLRLNLSSYLEPQLLAYSSLYWRNMCVIITQSTLIFRRPTLEIKLKILFISGCWLSRGLGGRLPRKHWLLALRHVSAHPLGHRQQPLPVSGQNWIGNWLSHISENIAMFQAGGTLAEVATEIQFDFVRTQLGLLNVEGSNNWWLSGTDVGVDGVWKWATSYSPVGDFVWYEGAPPTIHKTQNCLALNVSLDFMGINANCGTTGAFPICQIKPFWKWNINVATIMSANIWNTFIVDGLPPFLKSMLPFASPLSIPLAISWLIHSFTHLLVIAIWACLLSKEGFSFGGLISIHKSLSTWFS